MPDARLPSTLKGWAVALVASMVGFFAGFITVDILNKKLK